MSWPSVLAHVSALALATTACQFLAPPQQTEPAPEGSPRALVATRPPSGPTPDITTIYLPRLFPDGSFGLSPARRAVSASNERGRQAIELLIEGPNGDERANDFQYPLSIRTKVVAFHIADGAASIEMDQELERVRGRPFSELVYWSIVYTLTEAPGIHAVTLVRAGRPLREFGFPPLAISSRATRSEAPTWVRPR